MFLLSWSVTLPVESAHQASDNPREGWAVLMEMNYYESGSHLDTSYSDTRKWNSTLLALGWQTHHIFIHQGAITQETGEIALQFLAMNADANDVVLFFIFAHGNYLLNDVQWQTWFPNQWKNLESQEKLFIVAACTAEIILQPLYYDSASHIHLASTQAEEYAWAGLPEEGLPIIGEVFNHFFTNALLNASADSDTDGEVSVEEAFWFAAPLSRSYISSIVFPAFPDYAGLCNNTAPHPVIDDNYPGNFSLQIELGAPPITPQGGFPPGLGILVSAAIVGAVILTIGLLIVRNRGIDH